MGSSSSKQIKLGAVISYLTIGLSIAAGLLYTPWMVRRIGQSDYGLYTLALSVVNFFMIDFGISGAVSRFISLYRAQGREDKVKDLLGATFKLYLVIDAVIFLIMAGIFVMMSQIFVKLTPAELERFRVVFVIVGLYSVISFPLTPLNGILMSHEKFVALKSFDLISKIGSVSLLVLALLLGRGLYTLVLIDTLVGVAVKFGKLTYLKKGLRIKVNFRVRDRGLLRQIFGFSIWLTVISVAQRLIINISPSILGALSGSIQISVFTLATTLEGYAWVFANALNGLFLPKVTRLSVKSEDTGQITGLMIKVGRIQLFVTGIVIVGLLTMGREFIALWMGEGFRSSYYVALCLILPGIVTMTQEIAYNYLVAINEVRYRAYDYIGAAVCSLILSAILTPKFGAVGAGIAAGAGTVIGHVIVMNVIYHRVFHLDIPRFFKECHLKMALPLILTAAAGIFLQVFFPVHSLLLFIVKAAVLCVVYVGLMWVLGLNAFEKQLFLGPALKARRLIKNKLFK